MLVHYYNDDLQWIWNTYDNLVCYFNTILNFALPPHIYSYFDINLLNFEFWDFTFFWINLRLPTHRLQTFILHHIHIFAILTCFPTHAYNNTYTFTPYTPLTHIFHTPWVYHINAYLTYLTECIEVCRYEEDTVIFII